MLSHMSSVGRAIHGLSEKFIVTLTIHGKARTVTKSHYCGHVSAMYTLYPLIRVSLTVRDTLTVSG